MNIYLKVTINFSSFVLLRKNFEDQSLAKYSAFKLLQDCD